MLLWDQPDVVNNWVDAHHGGVCAPGTFTALGWVSSGEIVGGLVFYSSNGKNCFVNIALEGKIFPRGLLRAGLFYTFSQLKLTRLTFSIEEANLSSQNLVTRLGAVHEATLRDAGISGNLLIYALFPDACSIWSRMNGQRFHPHRAGPV